MTRIEERSFDNDINVGVLFPRNCASILCISPSTLEKLCQGFGTSFCCECDFFDYIPIDCLMLQSSDESEQVTCTLCTKLCPCNRTYRYEEVLREILKYENTRVNSKIG